MRERPIVFNGEMVRAILDGRKTQTRRVIKPQPESVTRGWLYGGLYFADDSQMQNYLFHNVYGENGTPYGSAYTDGTGDRLWVRETFALDKSYDDLSPSEVRNGDWGIWWKADHSSLRPINAKPGKWRSPIYMPRWASRITLEIVGVRVERVQDINDMDALAEGVQQVGSIDKTGLTTGETVNAFRNHWDSINAKRGYGWDANPWVWVVEFRKVL
jgi:hypothetical protein